MLMLFFVRLSVHIFVLIRAGEDCFWHMKGLADVKRFSMVMMFLSAKEKEGMLCRL